MQIKKITSLQHPQVLHWARLLKDRAYREQHRSIIISGEKLISELSQEKTLFSCLITLKDNLNIPALQTFEVTEAILKKITGLNAPDGFAAELPMPSPQNLSSCPFLLILDQIADPGNLGTLLRTAYALGWQGVALTPGTVDLFNDKAIRAAKGATFRLPYALLTSEELAGWNSSFYVADLKGENLSNLSLHTPRALILSNEAKGARSWAQDIGTNVHIPMRKGAESLNVASAGAILLYAMRPS